MEKSFSIQREVIHRTEVIHALYCVWLQNTLQYQ